MRSYLVLGDTGVYALDGLNVEGCFKDGSLSRNRSPRLYEGAAMAGIAVDAAVNMLDPVLPRRVCRYLTPLEPFLDREQKIPYPFGTFENFEDSRDPLDQPNLVWTVHRTKVGTEQGSRLRLREERRKTPHPFAVHSRDILESLRPGGVFEYDPELDTLRKAFFKLREVTIRIALLRGVVAKSKQISEENRVSVVRVGIEAVRDALVAAAQAVNNATPKASNTGSTGPKLPGADIESQAAEAHAEPAADRVIKAVGEKIDAIDTNGKSIEEIAQKRIEHLAEGLESLLRILGSCPPVIDAEQEPASGTGQAFSSDDVVPDSNIPPEQPALGGSESPAPIDQSRSVTPDNVMGGAWSALIEKWRQVALCQPAEMQIPDVLVLYDMYRGVRSDSSPPEEWSYRTGLRTVSLPVDHHPLVPYEFDPQPDGERDSKVVEERLITLSKDLLTVARAWIAHSFGSLVYTTRARARELFSDLSNAEANRYVDELVDTSFIDKVLVPVTATFAKEMVGKAIKAEYEAAINSSTGPEKQRLLAASNETFTKWQRYVEDGAWKYKADGDGSYGQAQEYGKQRHAIFDAVIRLTLKRLCGAERASRQAHNHRPRAEPLILCCLKSLEMPRIRPPSKGEPCIDYLNLLHRDPYLRARTIVLLDADYLRTLKDNPAGISSDFSWEETAFDTIEAFQRREHLKGYLDFGFVIVRFGVSGALLLSRETGGQLSAHLFFDPNKTDRDWIDPQRDSEVIGHSAIFAATIVQFMTQRCDERVQEPVLSDTREVLHLAIRRSLYRCQLACSYALGPAPDGDSHAPRPLDDWQVKAFEWTCRNNGIPKLLYGLAFAGNSEQGFVGSSEEGIEKWNTDKQSVQDYLKDRDRAFRQATAHFSSSVIPTLRSPNWSILGESCSADIEAVAYKIVNEGVEAALNKTLVHHDDWIGRVIKEIFGSIKSGFADKEAIPVDILKNELHELISNERSQARRDVFDKEIRPDVEPESIRRAIAASAKRIAEFAITAVDPRLAGGTEIKPEQWRQISQEIHQAVREEGVFRDLPDRPISIYDAPIGRFGPADKQLTVIDRREIEGISAVQRLITRYLEAAKQKQNEGWVRPLSVAVFGPPGSGKSTAVKFIAREHQDRIVFDNLEFNLAQLDSVSMLDKALDRINEIKPPKIPLVFFDEFDSKYQKEPLGWLKYFLAPMEDGWLGRHRIGPAILVFAGGTSYRFESFSPKNAAPSDQRWIDFSQAKGPDFVSRLSGHLNIVGIDPIGPDDDLFLLRRAVMMRHLLEKEFKFVDYENRAKVDDPRLLRAILRAPNYRYGGRSLRMLIEACRSSDGWLRRSSIPAGHELDMMVESKSFVATLRSNAGS